MLEKVESSLVFGYPILSYLRLDGTWLCRVVGLDDVYAVSRDRWEAEMAVRELMMTSIPLQDRLQKTP